MTKKTESIIFQIILWAVLFLFFLLDELEYLCLENAIWASLSHLIPIAILVFINIFWLIPNYLFKEEVMKYVLMLGACTFFFVFLDFNINHSLGIGLMVTFLDLIGALLMVGGISSIWIIIKQIQMREELAQITKEQVEIDLKFLKAQTNPHFLFNVLNNIHFLIQKDTDKASQTLLKLSDLLRYQLYETNEQFVEINKEIQNLENYIELEKIRVGDQLALDTTFDFTDSSIKIPPFLLLPLIENAFKHSLSRERGFISIRLNINDDKVDLKIENSLSQKNRKTEASGLGIQNLKKRLELLYPQKYHFDYGVKGDKYVAHLQLDLKKSEQH